MSSQHPAFDGLAAWGADHAAAGWIDVTGRSARSQHHARPFALASVTKPLFAYACLVAVEEGTLDLDRPIDGERTVADVLAHADGDRRRYANDNFDLLDRVLTDAAGMSAVHYAHEAVFAPLGLSSTRIDGSPAHAGWSTVDDLLVVAAEWLAPTLVHPTTMEGAVRPHRPELGGILPGFGRQDPNPWGLGFELRGNKTPHWLGSDFPPETFGHFGAAGTFVWVDRELGAAGVGLGDRAFGPWAAEVWPPFNSALRAAVRSRPA